MWAPCVSGHLFCRPSAWSAFPREPDGSFSYLLQDFTEMPLCWRSLSWAPYKKSLTCPKMPLFTFTFPCNIYHQLAFIYFTHLFFLAPQNVIIEIFVCFFFFFNCYVANIDWQAVHFWKRCINKWMSNCWAQNHSDNFFIQNYYVGKGTKLWGPPMYDSYFVSIFPNFIFLALTTSLYLSLLPLLSSPCIVYCGRKISGLGIKPALEFQTARKVVCDDRHGGTFWL